MKQEKNKVNLKLRLGFIVLAMSLAVLALVARAVQLQMIDQEKLQKEGNARYLREVSIPANRGAIYDRNGEPVAISSPVASIWVDPREFLKKKKSIQKLAHLLGSDPDMLTKRLEKRKNKRFVYI
ncbi:MAG: peptidoglycan D,D-transpeptidase FtsI family protein, partial [bacterium]